MFVIINGRKNNLPFAINGVPGYGRPGAISYPDHVGRLYGDYANACNALGPGGVLPLQFEPEYTEQICIYGTQTPWPWPWSGCWVVYYSKNGCLMALFTTQLAAQQFAAKLGSGYVTALCNLSAT